MAQEIQNKIDSLRKDYIFLKKESDDFIFNALCTQTLFFKTPSNELDESNLKKIIVDGKNDGGIDCILTDKESDHNDLVLIQCKYYEEITLEEVKAAICKLYAGYTELKNKHFSNFKEELVQQYLECSYEMESGAKVKLVFCTTGPRNSIKEKTIKNYFNSLAGDDPNITLDVYFQKELTDIVTEFESLRKTVSNGIIKIDKSKNFLKYFEGEEEDAIIVNASANSIKDLYSRHHLALFSQNLRFFVKSKTIDNDIKNSIKEYKEKFWYKNNGITVICDDFEVSGTEVHIKGFSIINGGQTTTLIGNYDDLNEHNDFYIPVKIIRIQGNNDDDRQQFIFDIAIATNSQKAIKPADLKANTPEQTQFRNELKNIGIQYRTKRGEKTITQFSAKDKNLDLPKACKLGLAGIFLMPGTSRNKPSIIYSDESNYYEYLFGKKYRSINARTIKDLLYIEVYFDSKFKKEYQQKTKNIKRVAFANNSRTLCLAYTGFLSKLIKNKFTEDEINSICNFDPKDNYSINKVQRILSDISKNDSIFNNESKEDLTLLESKLYKIFSYICKEGQDEFEKREKKDLDESNWLKTDISFYKILQSAYDGIIENINENPELYSIFKK